MNGNKESLALNAGPMVSAIAAQPPRVLFLTPGKRLDVISAERAASLARNLSDDGWAVKATAGAGPLAAADLRSSDRRRTVCRTAGLKDLTRLIPRFDIVHLIADSPGTFWFFIIPALVLARFLGKKTILSFTPPTIDAFLRRWNWLASAFFRMADRLVVDSQLVAATFRDYGLEAKCPLIPFDRSAYVYHEVNRLQPSILVDQQLVPGNHLACLIRAFGFVKQKYPRSKMTVIGAGSQRDELEKLLDSQRVYGVSLLGQVSPDQHARLYGQADLFANPSSLDSAPEPILRAFASGLPVVSTPAGRVAPIIRDRINGLIVAPGDCVGLAERIIELVENPDLVTRLTRQAATDVERYDWHRVGETWRQLYLSVAGA